MLYPNIRLMLLCNAVTGKAYVVPILALHSPLRFTGLVTCAPFCTKTPLISVSSVINRALLAIEFIVLFTLAKNPKKVDFSILEAV